MSDALSRAYVEIEPDFSEFNRSVDTGLRRATRLIESRIRGALANLEDRFAAFGREASSQTEDAFRSMADDAEDAADDITKAIRDIPTKKVIGINYVTDDLGNIIGQEDVTIDVDVDGNEIRDEVRDKVRAIDPPKINIPIDIDREGTFSRFLSSITGVRLPVAGFTALGTAAAAAGAAVVQFAAALAPTVGIVAALPAAIGVGAAAIGTLQVATAGFSDAMAAAFEDTEAFDAAIENLSPNAQAAAEAFRAAVPELQALQDAAQDAFFRDMDEAITSVAASLIGPLSEGMSTAAGEAGALVTALLDVAASESGINFINSSFAALNNTLAQLQEPTAALFTALLDLGTAINTAFGGEGASGLAAMIQQFADFIAAANASGESIAWVQNAMTVFDQLGAILSPIIGIIGSIGGAAAETGGNILGVFGEALQVFDDFLASAQGQETLIALFEGLNQVGSAFGVVLANIGPALPPLISGLSSILSVVTPLLGPLSELVGSVLGALAPILGIIASALQPLIGPLTTIITILGEILVEALTAVMPLIELAADLLGDSLGVALEVVGSVLRAVAPIFTVLFEAIQPIIEALTPLFELLGIVADIVGAVLAPIIQVLGDILLWLVDQVIVPFVVPIIELLADIIATVLGAAIQWLVEHFQRAGDGIAVVWALIQAGIESSVAAITAVWDALASAFDAGWKFIRTTTIEPMKNGFNALKANLQATLGGLRTAWNGFTNFISGIPGKISGSLRNMFSPLWEGFKSAVNSVISGWNNLSFSIPSVAIPGLGTVGGGTLNTPNIPYLQTGGFTTAQGLAMLHPDEMVLPLSNSNGINALAAALEAAGAGGNGGAPIQVIVQIGNETITQLVDTRVTQNNKTLTRRARAGTGRV